MSQGRRRNRNRNKSQNAAKSNGQNTGQNSGQNRRKKAEPKVDPVEFWGDPELLPEPISAVEGVPDVKAVVRSLGRVPLTGQETAAEHWFSLVYERAAVLAGALAAAGGLDGADDELVAD